MTVSVTAEDLAESPNTMFYNWSFTIDITPPTISNVNISDVTSSSATISWTTDDASDSVVVYWITISDSTLTTTHSITLTGLTANNYLLLCSPVNRQG